MFRCQIGAFEPDPSFPADLKKLGFFINNVGQIRMIEDPSEPYKFNATNNDRVNEVLREAFHVCEREEVRKRLEALGISPVYLPDFSTVKPAEPHISILAPPPPTLKERKRIIVLINDSFQDLGILAYRQLGHELGINGGSIINFIKELILRSAMGDAAEKYQNIFGDLFEVKEEADIPALIVMNTGQLLYSHKLNRSMTLQGWHAMSRKSSAHDMIQIHDENRVIGHHKPKDHVQSVFDGVLCNPDRIAPDAEIYVIAIEDGTEAILSLLKENFDKYGSRITAMALIHSLVDGSSIKNAQLKAFLHQRTRQWKFCDSTPDPHNCTDLPEDYKNGFETAPSQDRALKNKDVAVSWSENVSRADTSSQVTNILYNLKVDDSADDTLNESDEDVEWSINQAVPCPTFAGGDIPVGECVFTDRTVQRAILSFFEEVAQDPTNYHNPNWNILREAHGPTPENPLIMSPEEQIFSPLPSEITPDKAELEQERKALDKMRTALAACPENIAGLQKGREKLIKKIKVQETSVEGLETKMLASGGLKGGEAAKKRENWKPQQEGKKVAFAGTMVDSELLKAAGMLDTAQEELGKLEDEEKAFI